MTHRLPALLATFVLFGGAPATWAQDTPFDAAEALEEVAILLDEVEARLPTIDTVLEDTDFDAELLVQYMRDQIQYHPYEGVQRGVDGTLLARSANSWDQAITLSSLLTEAGYEAFVAFGQIGDVTFPDATAARLYGDIAPETAFTGLATARVAEITSLLDQASITLGGADSAAEVTYAWVKWRDAPGDDYNDVHPIFAQEPTGLTLTQTGSVTGTVPQEMVMSLGVRPFVEIKSGADISRVWVADAVTGAVANMWGLRQIYAFAPTTAAVISANLPENPEDIAQGYESLLNTHSFVVTRNGLPMAGAQHVDRRGTLLSPEDAASAMAGVFETVAANAGNAAAALTALGETSSEDTNVVPQLVGAGFELTLTGPEMPATTYVRHMLRADVPVDENDLWFADITQTFDLVVQPGPEPLDAIMQRTANDHGALLTTYQDLSGRPTSLSETFSAYDYRSLQSSVGMTSTIPVTSIGRQIAKETSQSGPFIAALITRIKPDPEFALDEQRRIFDILQRPVTGTPEAVLKRGVAESLAERFALPGGESYGAATLLSTDSTLTLMTEPTELSTLEIAEIAQMPMLEDLQNGYVIAVSGSTAPALAWWRIDPATGQTLGRSHAGWGNELTEFLSTMQISFSVTTTLLNTMKCGYAAGSAGGSGGAGLGRCILCAGVALVGDLRFDTGPGHGMATSACSL